MIIIAGLGNPGPKYEKNRHNIGFMAVDEIAGRWRFGPSRAKFQSIVADGEIEGTKILLMKPQTYICLLYTSPSPRDLSTSRMPSSA